MGGGIGYGEGDFCWVIFWELVVSMTDVREVRGEELKTEEGEVKKAGWGLILLLGSLAAMGPLAIDMYLPTMPGIAADLHTDMGQQRGWRRTLCRVQLLHWGWRCGQVEHFMARCPGPVGAQATDDGGAGDFCVGLGGMCAGDFGGVVAGVAIFAGAGGLRGDGDFAGGGAGSV